MLALGTGLSWICGFAPAAFTATATSSHAFSSSASNCEAISAAIADFAPDVVIHPAAWTDVDGAESSPEAAMAANAGATRNGIRVSVKVFQADGEKAGEQVA